MSTRTEFDRPVRASAPNQPEGALTLQEPPAISESSGGGLGMLLTSIPMAIASSATVLIFARPGSGSGGSFYLASGLMAVSTLGTMAGGIGRQSGQLRRKMRGERRDYLRYLTQTRRTVRRANDEQRRAAAYAHPEPAGLWTAALGSRLWERRPADPDFAEVRAAVGPQRAGLRLAAPQTRPVEDLEPVCARALRRFTRAYSSIPGQPIAVQLRSYSHLVFGGDPEVARGVVRAMLAELAVFHAPEDLRIAACVGPEERAGWEWLKWLPHAGHPRRHDGVGPVRLWADGLARLRPLLGDGLLERGAFSPEASQGSATPFVVVVLDGGSTAGDAGWTAGYHRAVILDVAGVLPPDAAPYALRLRAAADLVQTVAPDQDRVDRTVALGAPSPLGAVPAAALARLLAPVELAGAAEPERALESDFDLLSLLGIRDLDRFDPEALWAARRGADRLKVAIGVDQLGAPVALDIKEPAQGGVGPHGMLVGATGSGKSELLRTLVLALAVTHSPETLNFVLVDFKGGATFLGLERLFHTSALITNLADEVTLVARMQDTLSGELMRRQELLRAAGNYVSLHEYEKARAAGAPLEPMPTLFVVVDEFSELIAAHREFMDLFIVIGRLGRSLGVHLLLASQRLDQGRISQLETHLSYRIGLRTFSAAESRAVLGVPDAHHLPPAPGNGFLAPGSDALVRFKAAYVSGPVRRPDDPSESAPQPITVPVGFSVEEVGPVLTAEAEGGAGAAGGVGADGAIAARADFGAQPMGSLVPAAGAPSAVVAGQEAEDERSLMDVVIDKLAGYGPPAHEVWLPPLAEPPTLDQMLPPLAPDPELGLRPVVGGGVGLLRVAVGVVDRPFEQQRGELVVDLAGAGGHVGVAGGPQSGKSTLIRTLMAVLALTHTPAQVQFYGLDFSGGMLAALDGLPHTGGVAGRHETERISRTMAHLQGLLDERERRFAELGVDSMAGYRRLRARGGRADDPYGDVFLIIDGWSTLRQDFDDLVPSIRMFAARGLNYGIHLVIATTRWSELPAAIRDQLGTRLELRLGDAVESVIEARAAQTVPRDRPGRGLTADKLHFLAGLPRIDGRSGAEDLPEATAALVEAVARSWPGPAAPPVRTLPEVLDAAELPLPELGAATGDLLVPMAWDEQRMAPVRHDFGEYAHLAVVGDGESGRTNLLRLFADAIIGTHRPDEAQLVVIDPRRRLGDDVPEEYRLRYAVTEGTAKQAVADLAEVMKLRLPGPAVTSEQLRRRDWWFGPRVFLLADDYDLVAGSFAGVFDPLLELLPHGADIGLHVVAARAAAGAARPDALLRRLTELNCPGLLLSCPPSEGVVLGVKGRMLPPGRGTLVTRRRAIVVQTALLADVDERDGTAR